MSTAGAQLKYVMCNSFCRIHLEPLVNITIFLLLYSFANKGNVICIFNLHILLLDL